MYIELYSDKCVFTDLNPASDFYQDQWEEAEKPVWLSGTVTIPSQGECPTSLLNQYQREEITFDEFLLALQEV